MNSLVTLDKELVKTELIMSGEEELLKDIVDEENNKAVIATDEFQSQAAELPKANKLLAAIKTIHNYTLFCKNKVNLGQVNLCLA